MLMQNQAHAGQRTWFKAFVTIADYNGHVGLGAKCSKGVATAIRGPSSWSSSLLSLSSRLLEKHQQAPHQSLQGNQLLWICVPIPKGPGISSAPVLNKLLMAGIADDSW